MNKSLELNFLAHLVQQYRLLITAVFDGGTPEDGCPPH